jgi:hypothetical protein
MKNKPTCFFCQSILEADAVTINKDLAPYYALGNRQPFNVALSDEITLEVICPKCGAHGIALGDHASFKGSFHHSKRTIIEIENAIVQRLINENGIIEASHPVIRFNPSRRCNE